MALALVSAEFLTAVAMLVLLIGVPAFVIALIAVFSAYVRYDADRYLEELEAEGDAALEDDGR